MIFDELVEESVASLPPGVRELLDEMPVIVLDLPSEDILRSIGAKPEEAIEFCGLHSGRAFTEGVHEISAELPSEIYLFREGIVDASGGWDSPDAADRIYEEIMITLLHEIGHQFGLDEDDLERLGYQ
jgi:predicted Zn-dependent protease with MMP-like domain